MAKSGIDNVLGRLIGTPEPEPVAKPEPETQSAQPEPPSPPPSPPESPEPEKAAAPAVRSRGARRGRPPGSKAGQGGQKVKKTFAIDAELYDSCVARSWKEQMQMGEVIEKALRLYLKTPLKQSKE